MSDVQCAYFLQDWERQKGRTTEIQCKKEEQMPMKGVGCGINITLAVKSFHRNPDYTNIYIYTNCHMKLDSVSLSSSLFLLFFFVY